MKKILICMLAVMIAVAFVPTIAFAGAAEGGDGAQSIFVQTENGTVNVLTQTVKGMSYSKSKNTLTLNNYKNANAAIFVYGMGSSFKINVKGTCALTGIDADDSIAFTGTGKITLNKNKAVQSGASVESTNTKAKISFAKGLTVASYAGEWGDCSPVSVTVYGKGALSAKKAIVLSGKQTSKNSFKKATDESKESAQVTYVDKGIEQTSFFDVATNENGEKFAVVQMYDFGNGNGLEPVIGGEVDTFSLSALGEMIDGYYYKITLNTNIYTELPGGYEIKTKVNRTQAYVTGTVLKMSPKK